MVISSDGVLAQVERFANKFVFNRLNAKLLNKVINTMIAKCEKTTGNVFTMLVNSLFWQEVQETLSSWIRDWKTVGTFLFSKAANGYVEVGATYQTYEFAGNKLTFIVERAFDVEYPDRKFALLLDLTADSKTGKPGIASFTFKNGEFIHNFITGVGGKSGLAHGEVSSPVAASKLIN